MGTQCSSECDATPRGDRDVQDAPDKDMTDFLTHTEALTSNTRSNVDEFDSNSNSDGLEASWDGMDRQTSSRVSSKSSIRLSSKASSDVSTVASFGDFLSNLHVDTADLEHDGESELSEPERSPRSSQQRSRLFRRSQLARDMLPSLTHNHGDIKELYTLSKEVLANGSTTPGALRTATVKVTGAMRVVKFIPKSLAAEKMANVRERIDVLRKFDHPNVVSLRGIFEDESVLYLVMDHCQGGSLKNRLRQGPLSECRAVIVMQQVLRAVRHMHSHMLCHRDLTPHNILLAGSESEIIKYCQIKISGYGESCKLKGREQLSEVVGTPGYMAPEMKKGSYGKECDLWSCGAVLFEILCGRLPYENREEVVYLQQDAKISTSARDVVRILLESHPAVRCTAKQALRHKWFKKAMPKLSAVHLDASTLAHLKSFRKLSVFQQAAFQIVASHLSDQETANSRRLFFYLDNDGDGNLKPSELEKKIAGDPQISAAYPDISEIFRHPDENDSSRNISFTYTEFVAATFDREKCLTEGVCRVALNCFHRDGESWVPVSELSAGLESSDWPPEGSYEDLPTNSSVALNDFTRMLKMPSDNSHGDGDGDADIP